MTNSALKGRADDPRACRGVIRATFLTLPLVIFATLALSPLSANVDNSGNVSVQRCEAYADVTPTEYGYEFLEAVAGEAGLSVNDTVATVTGVTATATGLVVANSTGIVFGASGNRALDNLAEAADYPAWDTLTTEQQTAWGNKTNYDASKFNALLDAFGLDQDRDRFYSTGGANFEFSQNSIDNIKRLGRIGGLWANNIGVAIEDIRAAILNQSAINNWFPADPGNVNVFDSINEQNWPSGFPRYVNYVAPTDGYGIYYSSSGTSWYGFYNVVGNDVHGLLFMEDTVSNSKKCKFYLFSKTDFTLDYGWIYVPKRGNTSAMKSNYNGNDYYFYYFAATLTDIQSIDGITPTYVPENIVSTGEENFMAMILYGENASQGSQDISTVPDYPEDISDGEVIYYPPEGVSPEVVWNNYIQPQRPTNPYNPGNETGSSEWEQETKQNVMPLQNIKFDKLFPFCLMTDVKDLTEKIEQTITPGEQSDYLKIKIPMAYASDAEGGSVSEDIELDGTPLRDLLVMARPFNQLLLLFLMVFSLVMFWKSILTGD